MLKLIELRAKQERINKAREEQASLVLAFVIQREEEVKEQEDIYNEIQIQREQQDSEVDFELESSSRLFLVPSE